MLDEAVYTFGAYVEQRTRTYADLFMQQKQDEQSAKQGGSSRPSASSLMTERIGMQRHVADVAMIFATGELPAPRVRTPKRLRSLAELRQ
ncbi:MAG: hypothetical protein ACR2M1_10550 [Gemmatimonadaceae bacterium]